jgi:hypothetical protein
VLGKEGGQNGQNGNGRRQAFRKPRFQMIVNSVSPRGVLSKV